MGIRILIVEDEADLADFIVRGLREEGFAVEHALDAETAWDEMRAVAWDLIVLDWMLPGEDGMSVLRRFRIRRPGSCIVPHGEGLGVRPHPGPGWRGG